MPENPLSNEVLQFISSYVRSVEHLEILSLLVENPSRSWSVKDIFRCIQSTEKSVLESLQHFVKHKLATVEPGDSFRFSPEVSALTKAATNVVKIYRERRAAIIEAIYQKPPDSMQNFAEAFRLRKDK